MRFFAVLDFQSLVLAIFIALVVLILLYLSFSWEAPERKRERPAEEFPDGLKIEKNPLPPILVFIYSAFLIWAVAYMIVVGIKGGPF
jgi:hypothetical protein